MDHLTIMSPAHLGHSHALIYAVAFVLAILGYTILQLYNALSPVDRKIKFSGTKWKLPPGPGGLPILGNLRFLAGAASGSNFESKMLEMAKYGELTTLRLGSKTWILINSHRCAHELFAKRGSITSERSAMPVASGIISRDKRSLLQKQDVWTENRRVMHHLLSGGALKEYGEWQQLESTQMLAEYLYHPDQWYAHHYRYANSVVHRIALGERIEASGEDLNNLQRLVAEFTGSIGSSLVDWYPILDKVPRFLQWWRAPWERIGQFHNDVYHKWWDPTFKAIKSGDAPPSWARDVLLNPDSAYTGGDEAAMYTAMQLMEAGSDTTREALNIFIMAIIHNPDVFDRLRAEVDGLCRRDSVLRCPTPDDCDDLRYTAATVKEVLRWRPIFALTPDHVLTKDLEFEGWSFPKGTGFVLNGWAIANECEDPESFNPSRWLDGNELNVTHGIWQFGGGRRICVGYRLAQRSLILNIARLVQCFDFAAGGPLNTRQLNHETTEEPFPVKVMLRGPEYGDLIRNDAKAAGVLEIAQKRRSTGQAYTFHRTGALA